MQTLLKDQTDPEQTLDVEIRIEGDGAGIVVCPQGYGCFGCEEGTTGPIYLEFYEGRMRLLVWDDINNEDASHVIDLEGTKIDRRNDARTQHATIAPPPGQRMNSVPLSLSKRS